MNTFYIVRHGETENNRARRLSGWIDTPLTDTGLQPAEAVIKKLASVHIGEMYSSDMGRTVGTSDVVEVDESDEIVYGNRKNRDDDGLVPFVKTRQAQPSPFVSVYLVPQPDETYELSSAWIGTYGDDEPFPGSVYANEKSADYWHHHAFVYGIQEIVEGTETLISPW